MLVHHADAVGDGSVRVIDGDWLAADGNLALVRLVQAVDDVHQGALAGAVLAQQRVDFALLQGEIHVVVRQDAGESLGDPCGLQGGWHAASLETGAAL